MKAKEKLQIHKTHYEFKAVVFYLESSYCLHEPPWLKILTPELSRGLNIPEVIKQYSGRWWAAE